MTYEYIVDKVRETFENADAREIFEHVAFQVNIIGEGEGAFYIEVAARSVVVEPYDYHDRDGLVTATGDALITMAVGEITVVDAIKKGLIKVDAKPNKLAAMLRIKILQYAQKD